MSIETYEPIELGGFGGEVTLIDRSDLPQGVASSAKNIEFFPSAIRTRRGMDSYQNYGSTTAMDFVFAYRPDGTPYSYFSGPLAINAFSLEVVEPTLGTAIGNAVNYGGSSTPYRVFYKAYNRLTFAAVRNGANAESFPIKYYYSGNLSVANYAPTFSRAVAQPPQANGAYANSATAGNVSAGDHYFVVIFENGSGFRTAPMGPPVKLTATGSKKVDVSALPLGYGTSDIAKRLIFATSANPALGTNQWPLTGYYCVETAASAMVVGDDSTTSVSIDFTDAGLVNGTPLTQYVDNSPLPPCKGFAVYNQRTVAWGVRNALLPAGLSVLQTTPAPAPGVFNVPLSFDSVTPTVPTGWTVVNAGGGINHSTTMPGGLWNMAGDGVTLAPGKIRTSGDLFYGLTKGKEYRIRFLASTGLTGPGTGTLDISVTGSSVLISIVPTSNTYPKVYDFKLVDTTDALSAGAFLNIGLNNTPTSGSFVNIGDVMIYPSDTPFYGNTPWVSKAGQPEAFSNVTGFLGISDADVSQQVQCCFVLRSGLFMARETSVFGTTDNGTEPSTWPISKASDVFGACGPKAVALIDDVGSPGQGALGIGYAAGQALMVCKNGVALFDGSTATKVSQEIQPILDSVNWAYGHLVWATADPARKKVFIGLPVNGSTVINMGLVVDYATGWGDPLTDPANGRKWGEWTIGTQAGLGNFGTVDPTDARMVFCSNQGGTDINLLKWPSSTPYYYDYMTTGAHQLNVPSKYITACLPANSWGQYNFGGVTSMVNGSGNFVLNAVRLDNSLVTIPQTGTPRVLSVTPLHDTFIKMHMVDEHLSFQMQNGTNPGDYFALDMFTVLAKESPYARVRGI